MHQKIIKLILSSFTICLFSLPGMAEQSVTSKSYYNGANTIKIICTIYSNPTDCLHNQQNGCRWSSSSNRCIDPEMPGYDNAISQIPTPGTVTNKWGL